MALKCANYVKGLWMRIANAKASRLILPPSPAKCDRVGSTLMSGAT